MRFRTLTILFCIIPTQEKQFIPKIKNYVEKGLIDKKGKPDPIALYNLLHPTDAITPELLKSDRQAATDKPRNIRNWINGKNYPKNIADVLSLCNALGCELDYLFTDMQCKTHDKQFIQDSIGLSEANIEYLKYKKKLYCNYIDSLNILLSSDNFDNTLYHLTEYIKAVKLFQGLSKIRTERHNKIFSAPPTGANGSYNYPYNDNLEKTYKTAEKKYACS